MYKIRVKYFYYWSYVNYAPKNGVIRDNHSKQAIEFETRDEAIDYLCDAEGGLCNDYGYTCERDNDGTYSPQGRYVTKSGEYERPSYKIVKSRA